MKAKLPPKEKLKKIIKERLNKKDRTLLVSISVDKKIFKGKSDEEILETLFAGVSIPGGATVKIR